MLVGNTEAAELDRYGGDPRLKSARVSASHAFSGRISDLGAFTLSDPQAAFPVGEGNLVGKLVRPSDSGDRWFRIVSNTKTSLQTDPRDGDLRNAAKPGARYEIAGVFSTEKIGNRWWFISPDGNAFFPKAVSKTDLSNKYSQRDPNWLDYDAVYLEHDNKRSKNLAEAAADPQPGDVIDGGNATLREVNDVLLVGARHPIAATYFRLAQQGMGGQMAWFYSTSTAWKPLNSDYALNCTEGAAHGESMTEFNGADKQGCRIFWWKETLPADFGPRTLGDDSEPRYYIRGVVRKAFATPPVLSQLFEAVEPYRLLTLKYGNATNWVRATGERYRAWGWNMAGQYSILYESAGALAPESRMPVEPTVPLSGHAMDREGRWHIKNVYAGVQCPPASGRLVYQGKTPDVFDPMYAEAIRALAAEHIHSNPWYLHWIPEEADELFGLNKESHLHMGYAILAQNPWHETADGHAVEDHKLYSKYELRDFLRGRYSNSNSLTEQQALQQLNKAWGTAYTTWGTSAGDLQQGTHAWSSGTGLMDEDGRGIFTGSCDTLSFGALNKQGYPAVRKDLDNFVARFAVKYGSIIYPAVREHTANLITLPIYAPPLFVAAAMRPYTDALWNSFGAEGPGRARQIYDVFGKSMMVADYSSANHDSPLDFGGSIEAVRFDAEAHQTILPFSGRPYKLRQPYAIEFPTVPEALWNACPGVSRTPVPIQTNWREVRLAGNYSACLSAGDGIRLRAPVNSAETQQQRADSMLSRLDAYLNAMGRDGSYFVAGWEHWSMMDHPMLDADEHVAFGLVTAADNAYDGKEARQAAGRDRNGRAVGGEDADYGALIPKLSPFLHGVYDRLIRDQRTRR